MDNTIVAISTALGVGAISIIRVSGKDALDIVNKIFDKDLHEFKANTINYGHIINEGKVIDEVLVSVFLAPKTYTKEDIVEINSHGGIAVTNKIVELLLENGCTQAEPGEFTKRAFLNGRIEYFEIPLILEEILDEHISSVPASVEDIIEADISVRDITDKKIDSRR